MVHTKQYIRRLVAIFSVILMVSAQSGYADATAASTDSISSAQLVGAGILAVGALAGAGLPHGDKGNNPDNKNNPFDNVDHSETADSLLPDGINGEKYKIKLKISGDTGTLTWFSKPAVLTEEQKYAGVKVEEITGTLPAGLSLDPNSGVISGIPTASMGVYEFTIIARDNNSCETYTKDFSISVFDNDEQQQRYNKVIKECEEAANEKIKTEIEKNFDGDEYIRDRSENPKYKVSDFITREWYNAFLKEGLKTISQPKLEEMFKGGAITLEESAKISFMARHHDRVFTRNHQEDTDSRTSVETRDLCEYGHKSGPTFKTLVDKYLKKQGTNVENATKEQWEKAYDSIIESSTRPDSGVNRVLRYLPNAVVKSYTHWVWDPSHARCAKEQVEYVNLEKFKNEIQLPCTPRKHAA